MDKPWGSRWLTGGVSTTASTVHVTPDAAPGLCGIERELLGATVWDAGAAAPDLCRDCSNKTLASTNIAIAATAHLTYEREHDAAKQAMSSLVRVVPEGTTRDLVIYARTCLVRGDAKGAYDSLWTWRANMRSIGVFGQDD